MARVRIIGSGSLAKVFIDDVEVHDVKSVKLVHAGADSVPVVSLEVFAPDYLIKNDDIEVEQQVVLPLDEGETVIADEVEQHIKKRNDRSSR